MRNRLRTGQWFPMNIKDFSSFLGVSTATVSRAFSDKGRISASTRSKIRQKALELGYRPNIHARSLSRKHYHTISLFYPALIKREPDYFISEIILGANEYTSRKRIPLQIHPLSIAPKNFTDTYTDILFNSGVDGIIVIYGTREAEDLISLAKSIKLPYVIIGEITGEEANSITYPINTGAEAAGCHFVRKGKTRPVFIRGINDQPKISGFRFGLNKTSRHLQIDKGGSTFAHGAAAFKRIRINWPDTDCVFCANDVLAIGFIRAALSAGVKIPEDIAVIGCDDIKLARYYYPSLTTINFFQYELGKNSVGQLLSLMSGEKIAQKIIPCKLVLRESA